MKKIKSQADLKRLALASGASVEVGGNKFNTTMERVKQFVREEPEPEVAQPTVEETPAPAPVEVAPVVEQQAPIEESIVIHLDMDSVAQAIESGNERVVQTIADRLRELHVPASPAAPNSWKFTIRRDVRGFIESVDATPQL